MATKSIGQKIAEAWKAVIAAIPFLVYLITGIVSAASETDITIHPWVATVFSFIIAFGVWLKANAFSPDSSTSTPGPGTTDERNFYG